MKVDTLIIQTKNSKDSLTFKVGQTLTSDKFELLTVDSPINYININTKTGFVEIKTDQDNFLWYSLNDIQFLSFNI
ncbi:hypothetical protein SDC9_29492 [bioreactor metagenome]|uniref:Uncharacterized protein n=1 Tax=bioreactor metagenome TaxID=1076179 RepID=A0A644UX71_9ZZZZ|nr:hypothetical protein [Methanobrevibacter sp.]MEA4957880.1 hypothetical protein [Methanobrevibacter sp.]